MLNCKEMTEMCSEELDRKLLLSERMSLRMHLMMCSGCHNFRKQMQTMRIAMTQYANGAAVTTFDEQAGDR